MEKVIKYLTSDTPLPRKSSNVEIDAMSEISGFVAVAKMVIYY